MTAYYNEIDPFAAEWLQNLIVAGHIAPGDIDQRSIVDVRPSDLRGYAQCHFFAGIGGWSLALRLARWPDDRPVWTGSCPCQPFSAAGKGAGFADERHLWPSWYWLIGQCRPPIIFGEQVAAKAVEPWIDLVQVDLEALDYRFGAVAFPAASVGAPHIRDRLSFVADANGWDASAERKQRGRQHGQQPANGNAGLVGDSECDGLRECRGTEANEPHQPGHWSVCDWLPCRDGKARPVEPGTFSLVAGATARVGRLRAYGNSIVPQKEAEFIKAFMDCRP